MYSVPHYSFSIVSIILPHYPTTVIIVRIVCLVLSVVFPSLLFYIIYTYTVSISVIALVVRVVFMQYVVL